MRKVALREVSNKIGRGRVGFAVIPVKDGDIVAGFPFNPGHVKFVYRARLAMGGKVARL
jgi:hypothetical protein